MTTQTKRQPLVVNTYALHVMEIPVTRESFIYGDTAEGIFVQRVGDDLCFYKRETSDTDVARDIAVADYVVPYRVFKRLVESLRETRPNRPDDGVGYEDYRYMRLGRDQVRWYAPCGDIRVVYLSILDEVLAEFA